MGVLIIGISGVTCGGKTTLAEQLREALPGSRVICQDDYFLPVDDPRHSLIEELNHINFDILSSLDNEKMHVDVLQVIQEQEVEVLIVEGFCIFNYKPMRDLFHLKYYFTLDRDECFRRRVQRVYEPPDCPGYFEKCAWPEHLLQKQQVEDEVKGVVYFTESTVSPLEEVLRDISKILQ